MERGPHDPSIAGADRCLAEPGARATRRSGPRCRKPCPERTLLLDGTSFTTNMKNHGYTNSGGAVGENIAAGYATASAAFAAWKASAGHNANMLSTYFKEIGIGRAYNANSTYGWYWTTDFGGYADAPGVTCSGSPAPTATATAPQPTPTKTPTATAVPPTATNTPA